MATEHAYQDDDERGVEAYAPTPLAPATTIRSVASSHYSDEQIELIKTLIAPGLTDGELKLFLQVAHLTGLNPLVKQIYAIKRKDSRTGQQKMTIQTGIDGYLLLAQRTHELAGVDDAIFDVEGEAHPGKATVTVYRFGGPGYHATQRVSFTASARWTEYKQDSSPMWSKMPYGQLAKCALALALRKGFPAEMSGVYTDVEMDQADTPAPAPYVSSSVSSSVEQTQPATQNATPATGLRDRARAIGIPDGMYASQARRVIGHGAPYSADDQARWETWIAEREHGLAEAGATGDDDDDGPEMTFTEATPASATPDDLSALPVGQRGN